MKASNSPRPGLTCRLARFWSSVLIDGAAGYSPGWLLRHLEGCPCCQEYLVADRALERSLRQAAIRVPHSPPPFLQARILNTLKRSTQPAPPSHWPRTAVLPASMAAGLALLTLILYHPPSQPDATGTPRPSSAPSSGLRSRQAAELNLWTLVPPCPPAAAALLDASPLQNEADAVYADALSAVRFLAMNFLPITSGSSGPESE